VRQTPNVVTVVDLEEGAANIGKCNMCTRIITNDPFEFWCAETRLIGGKYFCGGCLLELLPIIEEVNKSYLEIKVEQIEKGFFYGIDEATGRIVVNDG
jgi:hypothetical protein|tara:strand:- start:74 stop:367 length:294 start_codon:yes stop_codon:yes gene_type:complete